MKRKLVAVTLAILLISFICAIVMPISHVSAQATTKVYIDPATIEDESLVPDRTFNISVKVDNIPADPGIVGIEFKLTWNASVLNAVNITEVIFHEVTPEAEQDNIWKLKQTAANDSASYAYTFQDIDRARTGGYGPIGGSHTIAVIAMRVKSLGKTTIHIDVAKLGDANANPLPRDTVDGFFSNVPVPPPPAAAALFVDPAKTVNASLSMGSNFTLSVNVANSTDLAGLEFKLGFNASALTANSITGGSFIPASVTPVVEVDNTAGFVKFNVSALPPLAGDGVAAVIEFHVEADGLKNSALHIYDVALLNSVGESLPFATTDGSFTNLRTIPGDINEDGVVAIDDAIQASLAFGSSAGLPNWNPAADFNEDGEVDIIDLILLALNFGQRA